ncbi:Copia protein [Dufourea novaeangliae]|uniref:Copia protein n=1 Tax=Dufourea novaeangliae TaxID=178035 RepID=A0A154PMU4_DUFNO|nr:Copia protein [Dufourea novaeangliae]
MLDVSEGKLVRPETDEKGYNDTLKRYQKADKAARKLIDTTVERKPLDLLLSCTTAEEIWKKLNVVYDMKSDENLSLIQKRFFDFKWECSEGVAHNLSKLEQRATKMKSLGSEIPDSMLLTRVLSTLPQKFNHFHSAWDSVVDSKKNLENLTARLMSEEVRIQNQQNSEETTVALFTNSVSKNKNYGRTGQNDYTKKRKSFTCYTCGKKGHKKKDCTGCYTCGSKGHLSRNCLITSERLEMQDGASSMQQFAVSARHLLIITCEKLV